jgi:hypothetical protein
MRGAAAVDRAPAGYAALLPDRNDDLGRRGKMRPVARKLFIGQEKAFRRGAEIQWNVYACWL